MVKKSESILRAAKAVGLKEAHSVFIWLNNQIRASARKEVSQSSLDFYALSRRIFHIAIAMGEAKNSGKTGRPKPAYSELLAHYEELRSADEMWQGCLSTIDSDELSRFCNLQTRRQASGKQGFYASIAMLAIYFDDVDREHHDFLHLATPTCERALVDRLYRTFGSRLNDTAVRMKKEAPLPGIRPPSERQNPEVFIGFDYKHSMMEAFSEFVSRYRLEEDGHAHFVVFRPRKKRPQELMKSFLAVKEHQPDQQPELGKNFQFTHVYQPPRGIAARAKKLSMGRIVPMDNGVYLVGGQRSGATALRAGQAPKRKPFRSLNLMYFPWKQLEDERDVIVGMGLFPNNDGELMASRIAMVATFCASSERASLGDVSLEDLETDVEAMIASEPPESDFPISDEVDAKDLAERILDACNNDPIPPAGWNVGKQFISSEDDGFRLDQARIEAKLNEVFGSVSDIKYATEENEIFQFWKSIRFGPLVGPR